MNTKMRDIINAIFSIRPNAEFIVAESYSSLDWHSKDQVKPTEVEFNDALKAEKAKYDAQAYSRSREAEYPSVQECVHAILDDTLDALQAKRASIKTKFPKG